jgi:hypothetical protein
MKAGQDAALRFGVEVHQGVTADDQVDARDRRILDEVVAAEDDRAPQLLVEREPTAFVGEVLAEQRPRDRGHGLLRIAGGARLVERPIVDVGRVDLDALTKRFGAQRLGQQHRQRVGLLARRAACRPDADRTFARDQRRHDVVLQVFPGRPVAKERGDVDQHRVEQLTELLGMNLEVIDVIAEALDADAVHALAHPAHQARLLVGSEVEPAGAPQILEQPLEIAHFARLFRPDHDAVSHYHRGAAVPHARMNLVTPLTDWRPATSS